MRSAASATASSAARSHSRCGHVCDGLGRNARDGFAQRGRIEPARRERLGGLARIDRRRR